MLIKPLFKQEIEQFSRREFLKKSTTAAFSLFMLPYLENGFLKGNLIPSVSSHQQLGRILRSDVVLYDKPSFSAQPLKILWKDQILPINTITINNTDEHHNHVWYLLDNQGYTHSGVVQPVELNLNPEIDEIPAEGQLAEVTVPYTDAVWNPARPERVSYRFYYSSVYWVKAAQRDDLGELWYRVLDDKYKVDYFVKAKHLRLIPPEDLSQLSPEVPAEEKRLEVLLTQQAVIAYEANKPVFMTRAATGARFIDGDYRTEPGMYMTNRKRPTGHMAAGDPVAPTSYDLPGVPWICFLTESGISFHGTYWHNDYGLPRSHGCINLACKDALWVYRWTNPTIPPESEIRAASSGTIVKIIP